MPAPIMNRAQVLESVNEAYRLGCMSGSGRDAMEDIEDGGTIYWKRNSGKVASFFRCLLR